MAFPHNHVLLTVEGDAWSGNETWQFGLHFDTPTLPTATGPIDTAINTWFINTAVAFDPAVRYLGFKAAIIAPDGKYPPGHVPLVFTRAVPQTGKGINSVIPQASIVVSLKTALPRGRGHAGRFYPPPQDIVVSNDGRVQANTRDSLMLPYQTLFNALVTAMGGRLVVASSLASTFQPVNRFAIGRVIDTQRRRRSSLSEEYAELSITNP